MAFSNRPTDPHPYPSAGQRPGRGWLGLSAVAGTAGVMAWVALACASTPVDRSTSQCQAGTRAAEAGRWEEAEFRWLKALAIDPAAACAHNNLAVHYERQGKRAEAEVSYREALDDGSPAERPLIQRNYEAFLGGRRGEEGEPSEDEEAAGVPASGLTDQGGGEAVEGRVRTTEVTISVPGAEARDLADYQRILVGNFVITTEGLPVDLNAVAVGYLRRRLVQRTFFQTVDLLEPPLPETMEDPAEHPEIWVERAGQARAGLVLTGRMGMETNNRSRVVRERIRTPAGTVEEVARFREITGYAVKLQYALLRGEDGRVLRTGELEAEREFPADQNLSPEEAVVETLEEMLPQLLAVVSPSRTEQTRLLIY